MIQYLFLLITRIGTIIPISIFLFKQIIKFRDKDRDMSLEKTRKGVFVINISMLIESILFALYDFYKIFNHIDNPTPIFMIAIWCLIRVALVYGIWLLFSILFEKD